MEKSLLQKGPNLHHVTKGSACFPVIYYLNCLGDWHHIHYLLCAV